MNQWFFAGGDSGFYWMEQIASFSWLPRMYQQSMELGVSRLHVLWFDYPFRLVVKLFSILGISWWGTEKILWLGTALLAVFASYRLATYVQSHKWIGALSALIYTTNTYALLLFGGGQLGVALAYSLAPLVLLKFITAIDQLSITNYELKKQNNALSAIRYQDTRQSIINGLWFALLVCCDLRLAYLVMGAISLYTLLRIADYLPRRQAGGLRIKNVMLLIVYAVIIPLVVAGIFHLFWILPIVFGGGGASLGGEEYTNAGMLQFLSVADFSHALSLLHPNWPENLFGRVYFLQPEFLVFPMLAFSSLLFFDTFRQKRGSERSIKYQVSSIKCGKEYMIPNTSYIILFFAFLSLMGAFLAKGVNPPFGGVYDWLFAHVPGFIMFRDPTKFYLYVAIGYSVLIPSALYSLANNELRITDWNKNIIRYALSVIITIVFLCFWCFTIRQVFLGQLSGNFKPLRLDDEFIRLKTMLVEDQNPSRTLWIPSSDAFAFSSDMHPTLSTKTLLTHASLSGIMQMTQEPSFIDTIKKAGVRYVIVPMDQEKRIFLSDYVWDPKQRDDLIASLGATALIPHPEFQKLAVFENQDFVFQTETPPYIEKQEQWSNIGLGITIAALVVFLGVVVYK